jgi:hypothetical protein
MGNRISMGVEIGCGAGRHPSANVAGITLSELRKILAAQFAILQFLRTSYADLFEIGNLTATSPVI